MLPLDIAAAQETAFVHHIVAFGRQGIDMNLQAIHTGRVVLYREESLRVVRMGKIEILHGIQVIADETRIELVFPQAFDHVKQVGVALLDRLQFAIEQIPLGRVVASVCAFLVHGCRIPVPVCLVARSCRIDG